MKRFDRVWALLPECLDGFIDESKSCSRGRWHVTREHAATNVAIHGLRRRAAACFTCAQDGWLGERPPPLPRRRSS